MGSFEKDTEKTTMKCEESESIFSDGNTRELWCWLILSPTGFYHFSERKLEHTLANVINLCSAPLGCGGYLRELITSLSLY